MMVSFGNASGPLDPCNVTKSLAPKGLYLTRPSIAHYPSTKEELDEAANKVFDMLIDQYRIPFITDISINTANTIITDTFNEKIYKSNNSTATLDNVNYFKLSTSQGSLTLKSSTPESLKQNESEVDLEFVFTGTPSK